MQLKCPLRNDIILSLKPRSPSAFPSLAAFTTLGWITITGLIFTALASAYFLAVVVERVKKSLDFAFTLYFLHLLVTWAGSDGGFPLKGTWWMLQVLCFILTAALGEYLCLRREMQDISVDDIMASRQRRQGNTSNSNSTSAAAAGSAAGHHGHSVGGGSRRSRMVPSNEIVSSANLSSSSSSSNSSSVVGKAAAAAAAVSDSHTAVNILSNAGSSSSNVLGTASKPHPSSLASNNALNSSNGIAALNGASLKLVDSIKIDSLMAPLRGIFRSGLRASAPDSGSAPSNSNNSNSSASSGNGNSSLRWGNYARVASSGDGVDGIAVSSGVNPSAAAGLSAPSHSMMIARRGSNVGMSLLAGGTGSVGGAGTAAVVASSAGSAASVGPSDHRFATPIKQRGHTNSAASGATAIYHKAHDSDGPAASAESTLDSLSSGEDEEVGLIGYAARAGNAAGAGNSLGSSSAGGGSGSSSLDSVPTTPVQPVHSTKQQQAQYITAGLPRYDSTGSANSDSFIVSASSSSSSSASSLDGGLRAFPYTASSRDSARSRSDLGGSFGGGGDTLLTSPFRQSAVRVMGGGHITRRSVPGMIKLTSEVGSVGGGSAVGGGASAGSGTGSAALGTAGSGGSNSGVLAPGASSSSSGASAAPISSTTGGGGGGGGGVDSTPTGKTSKQPVDFIAGGRGAFMWAFRGQ